MKIREYSGNRWVKWLASIGLLAAVLLLIIHNRTQLVQTLQETNTSWLAGGFICYCLNYLARSQRMRHVCPQLPATFPGVFKVSALHGFFSYILPLRAGDVSLPVLLKNITHLPYSQGNTIFIRTRLADFLGLGFLIIVAVLAPNSIEENYYSYLFLIIGVGLCLLPFMGIRLLRFQRVKSLFIFKKIFGSQEFHNVTIPEGISSVIIWFWTGCTSYCVIKAINLPLSPFDAWFLSAIQLPLQLLPIQGVANAGTHEAGWTMGLTLLGTPANHALTAAIASHFILLLYICLLGAIAALLPTRNPLSQH